MNCCATWQIPSDGRSEMGVDWSSETIVAEIALATGREVYSLHHAASGKNAQQCVQVRLRRAFCQLQALCQCLCRVCTQHHVLAKDIQKDIKSR